MGSMSWNYELSGKISGTRTGTKIVKQKVPELELEL